MIYPRGPYNLHAMKEKMPPEGVKDGQTGRVLALDLGDRRIGLAISDPFRHTARPLMTLGRVSRGRDMERIREVITEQEVATIVVGMPLNMDGSRGPRARLTKTFIDRVRGAMRIPVYEWDERLTTVQAERVLIEGKMRRERRRVVIDQVAAVIILQSYLDAKRCDSAG